MPPPSNAMRDRLRQLRSWLAGDRRRQAAAPRAARPPPPSPVPPSPTPPPTEPTLLDGVLVYPEQLAEIQGRLPLAVMFDNFVSARPQVGLEKVDLVVEVG